MDARRMSLSRWIGYGAAFFAVWFFSAGIFANFPLMGSVPDLVPVCIAFVAVLEGSLTGSLFGLGLGLFSWLARGETGMIFLGATIGMLSGSRRLSQPWIACMVSALLALIAAGGMRILTGTGSVPAMLRIAGWEMAYSMLLAVLFYPLFRWIHRRFGRG